MLNISCYSCGEPGHIASTCPKVHFFVEDRTQVIQDFHSLEKEFRHSFKRRECGRFHARQQLEKLHNDAIELRSAIPNLENLTSQAVIDTYDHLYEDSFEEVLDRKVYHDYYLKTNNRGENRFSDPVIDSLESVENVVLQNQRDSLHPYQYYNSNGSKGGNLFANNLLARIPSTGLDNNPELKRSLGPGHPLFG